MEYKPQIRNFLKRRSRQDIIVIEIVIFFFLHLSEACEVEETLGLLPTLQRH